MNKEFIIALEEIEKEKGISVDILLEALEAALISAYRKNFSTPQNVRVSISQETGDIRVFAQKAVVEEVTDSRMELSLEEAREIRRDYEIGDVVEDEVTPRDFGRIAAQTAKQVVVQRIREAERNIVYEEFSSRESDVMNGIVQRTENGNIFIDFGKTEGMLPVAEQIPYENYRNGDRIKVYIVEVKKANKGPQIIISRTHPGLLKRLFELEVPEIHDGTVEIKNVSREAGARSKIAVWSADPNVDPVGSCVGQKGSRVQRIVDELGGEKIDIIAWDEDPRVFVANALSPARVLDIFINHRLSAARVVVPDNQLSLAIGKEGQNARLAAKLSGWKIDIKSESQAAELNDFVEDDPEEIQESAAALESFVDEPSSEGEQVGENEPLEIPPVTEEGEDGEDEPEN